MPSSPTSSSLPRNGETKVAPAFAAKRAWAAENTNVTLVFMPFLESIRTALSPSSVMGTLTTTFAAHEANPPPSAAMSSAFSETPSTETGPGTNLHISRIASFCFLPDFNMSVGLVVTPSTMPISANLLILSASAVSRKIFMQNTPSLFFLERDFLPCRCGNALALQAVFFHQRVPASCFPELHLHAKSANPRRVSLGKRFAHS